MNLGMRCKYADECPVFSGKTPIDNMPLHLVRNVFCNRGSKGWVNCSRYRMMEKNVPVAETVTPYSNHEEGGTDEKD
jgi:hypothetical protein